MIDIDLLNYGVLGLWTVSLLVERYKMLSDLKKVIEELKEEVTKVCRR